MPRLLTGEQAKGVANYLLQGVKTNQPAGKGALTYAYYKGAWDKVPDFDKLKPVARGTAAGFDVGVARRNDDFALKFDGFFKVNHDGDHTFTVTSDDGSRLYVNGKLVVDNDGVHAPGTKDGTIQLTKGIHKVTVAFFQVGGGTELEVLIGALRFRPVRSR